MAIFCQFCSSTISRRLYEQLFGLCILAEKLAQLVILSQGYVNFLRGAPLSHKQNTCTLFLNNQNLSPSLTKQIKKPKLYHHILHFHPECKLKTKKKRFNFPLTSKNLHFCPDFIVKTKILPLQLLIQFAGSFSFLLVNLPHPLLKNPTLKLYYYNKLVKKFYSDVKINNLLATRAWLEYNVVCGKNVGNVFK